MNEIWLIGEISSRSFADTVATRLQRTNATGGCNQGSHSPRVRGAFIAWETFTKFYRSWTSGVSCHGTNSPPSEKGTTRVPFRSTVTGVAQNAAVTFSLQVKINLIQTMPEPN